MTKIKSLQPSLREKKRYLALEVLSDGHIADFKPVSSAIWTASLDFMGVSGCADAGIMTMNDRWDSKSQRTLIRVSNKHVNDVKTALSLVKQVGGTDAIIRCVGVSGVIKKAQEKYVRGG